MLLASNHGLSPRVRPDCVLLGASKGTCAFQSNKMPPLPALTKAENLFATPAVLGCIMYPSRSLVSDTSPPTPSTFFLTHVVRGGKTRSFPKVRLHGRPWEIFGEGWTSTFQPRHRSTVCCGQLSMAFGAAPNLIVQLSGVLFCFVYLRVVASLSMYRQVKSGHIGSLTASALLDVCPRRFGSQTIGTDPNRLYHVIFILGLDSFFPEVVV